MQQKPDLSQLMRLALSPAGQQLLELLKKNSGEELRSAMASAASGDYALAKTVLEPLLDTPEARKLLTQLEDNR